MKLMLMKHTLAYILAEVEKKSITAIEQINYYESMEIVDKGNYLVLTDETITYETS